MHSYDEVISIVEASRVHVAHEVDESVLVAKKHVDCTEQNTVRTKLHLADILHIWFVMWRRGSVVRTSVSDFP